MVEIYLNGDGDNLRLPVVPSEFNKIVNADISAESIVKKGKVNIYNGYEPSAMSISCFFPHEGANYHFATGSGDPYSYVNRLEKWCREGTRLRYIVTGTSINVPVRISHFEYSERDSSGDVYYTLDLKEDEDINIPTWQPGPVSGDPKNPIPNKVYSRNKPTIDLSKQTSGRAHTVKHGEYLYLIAQKYYGDGSKYKKITANAENLKRYPNLKKSNIIYSDWKLVIP